MKLFKFLAYALLGCAVVYSCKSDESDVGVASIKITTQNFTLTSAGESKTLEWVITPPDATNTKVSWLSRNSQIASVDQNGKVAAIANGSTYIIVNTVDGNKRDSIQVTINIPSAISDLTLEEPEGPLAKGQTFALSCKAIPNEVSNDKLIWTSRNINVATVSKYGVVTAVDVGSTYIVAEDANSGLKDSVQITVIQPVAGISINEPDFSLTKGQTKQLTYSITPADAPSNSVSWQSSNTNIVTVSSSGLVSAVNSGKTYITVKVEDTSIEDKIEVTVLEPVTGVSVSPTSLSLFVGYTGQLTATIEPSNAANKKVEWTSSNPDIATVSSNGIVKAVTSGNIQITATTISENMQAHANITAVEADISGTYSGDLKGSTIAVPGLGISPIKIEQSGEMTAVQNSLTSVTLKIEQTIEGIPISEEVECKLNYSASKCTLADGKKQVTVTIPPNDFGIPQGNQEVEVNITDGTIDVEGKVTVNVKIKVKYILWWDVFEGAFTGTKQ